LHLFDLPGETRGAGLVRELVSLDTPEGEKLPFPIRQLPGAGQKEGVIGLVIAIEGGQESLEPLNLLDTVVDVDLHGIGFPFVAALVALLFAWGEPEVPGASDLGLPPGGRGRGDFG
jgi:hypothetical protein